MSNFEINIDTLFEAKLGFEAYFILYCIHTKNKQLITTYTTQCKKIETNIFKQLQTDGYLDIKNQSDHNIYFELLSLANKGIVLFSGINSTFDLEKQFGEFRTCYPMVVKEGLKSRRLHTDLSRCKKLYETLLMETTHDILCKCAKIYTAEKFKSNEQIYMQDLSTWLHQKNYLLYVEDVDKEIQPDKTSFDTI
jgi:hypothetical protein